MVAAEEVLDVEARRRPERVVAAEREHPERLERSNDSNDLEE